MDSRDAYLGDLLCRLDLVISSRDFRIPKLSGLSPPPRSRRLFSEDQEASDLYLVMDGAVELVIKVEDTIEIPIAIVRPDNGCLGVSALIEPYRYTLSARCLDDSKLLAIPKTHLDELMNADSEMRCVMMTNLATKLLNRLKETRQEVKLHFMNLVRSVTF
jgi:CRP-like cAMP-binding protein